MSNRLKWLAAAAAAPLIVAGLASSHAQDKKYDIVTVVKIDGIQWFNRMEEGVRKFAADTGHKAEGQKRTVDALHENLPKISVM